jgi:hypothetical protein
MLVSFPQEDSHHTDRVLNGKQPMEVGQAGRAALEIASAAHETARKGCKMALPFVPPEANEAGGVVAPEGAPRHDV